MPKYFSKEAFANCEARMNAKKKQPESSDEDSLPEINEEQICSICLSEVLWEYLRLQCGHYFHRKCILRWKKIKSQCPYCRLTLNKLNLTPHTYLFLQDRLLNRWKHELLILFVPLYCYIAIRISTLENLSNHLDVQK